MKAVWLKWFLLVWLIGSVFASPAEQSDANGKLLADSMTTKPDQSDALGQFGLAGAFFRCGLVDGVPKAVLDLCGFVSDLRISSPSGFFQRQTKLHLFWLQSAQ